MGVAHRIGYRRTHINRYGLKYLRGEPFAPCARGCGGATSPIAREEGCFGRGAGPSRVRYLETFFMNLFSMAVGWPRMPPIAERGWGFVCVPAAGRMSPRWIARNLRLPMRLSRFFFLFFFLFF